MTSKEESFHNKVNDAVRTTDILDKNTRKQNELAIKRIGEALEYKFDIAVEPGITLLRIWYILRGVTDAELKAASERYEAFLEAAEKEA